VLTGAAAAAALSGGGGGGSMSGSHRSMVAQIQANGGLVRTNILMKNTILRIAFTNKKQASRGGGA
jgi:hypothetical protein